VLKGLVGGPALVGGLWLGPSGPRQKSGPGREMAMPADQATDDQMLPSVL